MKKILTALLLCTGTINAAQAEIVPYIGGQIGYSKASSPTIDSVKPENTSGMATELHLGVLFPITDSFFVGPEIGYGMFSYSPKYDFKNDGTTKFENNNYIPIVIKAQIQLSEDFYLFAKAGMAHVNGKIKIQDNRGNESIKQSAWESTFALGTGFELSDNLALEANYTYVNGKSNASEFSNNNPNPKDLIIKTNNVFVGLNYNF